MRYYPIGTVVTLRDGERPIMIYGRKQVQADTNSIWDYVACIYPEGNINDEFTVFFQQEEIENVLHMGYCCDEEEIVQELLNQD
ncbi:MAG: DUF4176 domain-containing protein [Oscillospiraceae bacterium]